MQTVIHVHYTRGGSLREKIAKDPHLVVDVAARLGLATNAQIDAAKAHLRGIVAMLIVLARNKETPRC